MNSIIKNINKITNIFLKYIGKKFYILLIFSLISNIAETFGIMMLLPLFQLLENNGEVSVQKSKIINNIDDVSRFLDIELNVYTIFYSILVLFILKGSFIYFAYLYQSKLEGELGYILRKKLFDKYSSMTYEYYLSKNTGYFINIISEQIRVAQISFGNLVNYYIQVITALAYISVALFMSFWFGIIVISIGLLIILTFKKINLKTLNLSRLEVIDNNNLYKLSIQFIHSFKYLVATAQTKQISGLLDHTNREIKLKTILRGNASAITTSLREPLAAILISLAIFIQTVIYNQEIFSILISIAFLYRGYNTVYTIQSSYQGIMNNSGSIEIINTELLNQDHDIKIFENKNIKFKNEIQLININFKYPKSEKLILNNINLSIQKNKTIAIVGESGSGKSTLVDIISLMHQPQQGALKVDNVLINDLNLNKWREKIGYVTQEPVIFDDTILNNIILWDECRDFNKVFIAAEKAQIKQYIQSLPDGFNTDVGDRGLKLSGGQRQRIALARELYRNPEILILDEATSALDSKTEDGISQTLSSLMGNLTLVIIAHRLSTIKNADLIYVLKEGLIVECGSFEELMLKNTYFSELMLIK